MSLKLTGARPPLSLWLEQAPWGIAIHDKWVVLQINCSYCPCSATLTKGEQCWPCWCWATITHRDELTLNSEVHITIMSSYQALITQNLINSATVNQRTANMKVFDLFPIPYPIPQYIINYKSVMNVPIQLKDFELMKRDKMINWFSE